MGLGLHGGGAGAAAFFAHAGARVTVTDVKSRRELLPSVRQLVRFRGITYHLGGHRPENFRKSDYVIKNPGVRDDSRFLKIARAAGAAVLSDVEVFFRASPATIIGVTGTKGKTTTTWLIGELLKQEAGSKKQETARLPDGQGNRKQEARNKKQETRVWVGGNIRTSMLEFLPRVRKGDTAVLELSSFQLDSLASSRVSPHIAVITNVFPDHLNRYPSMRAYAASKAGIFRFQKRGDYLFVNRDDARLRRLSRRAPGHAVLVDVARTLLPFRPLIAASVPAFHLPNIALAIAVAKRLGVGDDTIRGVLRCFRGIPGRMELVRTIRGVRYINDTTATNPTAALEAVRAVKRGIGKGRVWVIAGGSDKGLPAGAFCRALARDAAAVIFLPGEASRMMKSEMRKQETGNRKQLKTFGAKSMQEAVRVAYRNSNPGDAVLLSPGAASFGLFRHEFDRGDQFVKAVKALR